MKLWAFVFIALSQQCFFGGDVSGFTDAAARRGGVEAVLLRRVSSPAAARASHEQRRGWLYRCRCSLRLFTGEEPSGTAARRHSACNVLARERAVYCAAPNSSKCRPQKLASGMKTLDTREKERVFRTPTTAIHRRPMALCARQQLRETTLVSQVSSPKITKYVEQRGNRCSPGTSDRREPPTHTYEAAPASKGQPAHR